MSLNVGSPCISKGSGAAKAADPICSDFRGPDSIKRSIKFSATGPAGAGNGSNAQEEMQKERVDNVGLLSFNLGKVTEDNASSS